MPTVLITGISGFIGSHVAAALVEHGYRVMGTMKSPPKDDWSSQYILIPADYTRDFDVDIWRGRLAGVDVVINAVGILREHESQTFDALHVRTPLALFAACATEGVKVIQISALGADQNARSQYHLSKKRADDALLGLEVKAVVVQPSLVYGVGGASARMFNFIASLPIIPLPGQGDQQVQPIHIDDLTRAMLELVKADRYMKARIPLVGPEPVTMKHYLGELRRLMGLGRGIFLNVPVFMVDVAARIGQKLHGGLLDVESWQMLQRGNTADPGPTRELLGRDPRPVTQFISRWNAPVLRSSALLDWFQFVLRLALAIVWLVAGIVSMGIYPVAESYALLAGVGITGGLAPPALYGAAALDIAFGLGTLFLRRRKLLWISQVALIGLYSLAITIYLPEFWLHPFGPLVKNLPILASIWLLYELEKR
jgi:uncharacterized protein YbjT (DUF2867 family)